MRNRVCEGLILAFFPERLYEDMAGYLDAYFDLFRAAAAAVARERMQAAADAITDVVARNGTIFSCGNGGSAAVANHLGSGLIAQSQKMTAAAMQIAEK